MSKKKSYEEKRAGALDRSKRYRDRNREKLRAIGRESMKARRAANPELVKAEQKRWATKLRLEVISHYSNGTTSCACCGESHIEFLHIDHIDGGGTQLHRKKLQPTGLGLYHWLRKRGYPDGYRVLCANCNHSLGRYGYCPHGNLKGGLKWKEITNLARQS